jgi:hypothetical protein
MKKSDFKELIKESVKEVLVEEGVLRDVISEVVKAVGTVQVEQSVAPPPQPFLKEDEEVRLEKRRQKLGETKKKMLDAIGSSAYGGVDLFEGTTPMRGARAASEGPSPSSALEGVDPGDSGVDISGLIGGADAWKQLIK